MNRFLVSKIVNRYYQNRAEKMKILCIVTYFGGEVYGECVIIPYNSNEYIIQQIRNKWNKYDIDYDSFDILNLEFSFRFGEFFSYGVGYILLDNNDLVYERLVFFDKSQNLLCDQNIKKYEKLVLFIDSYGCGGFCFCNDVNETSLYIQNRLKECISSDESNIFSKNIDYHSKDIFNLQGQLKKKEILKMMTENDWYKDWYYYFVLRGKIDVKIISTNDIKIYKKN
jgi:hypothetical protein